MTKGRLEAFSDGVLAIIITIMVLELRPPHTADFEALRPLLPVFLSYLLSFVFLGIYWNNHHHLLQAASRVSGGTLWANLHLLFWLTLIPFVTNWMGDTRFAALPVAAYGIVLIMAGCALLHPRPGAHRGAWKRFSDSPCPGPGCERQTIRGNLCRGDSAGVCRSADRVRLVCVRGNHLARPGSPN